MLALLAGTLTTCTALTAEISARQVEPNKYELVLTNQTVLGENEARAYVTAAAASICKDRTPVLGRFRFDAKERIGGGAPGEADTYVFVQEVSCAPRGTADVNGRRPTLRTVQEAEHVQEDVRLRSEAYFGLISKYRIEEAYAQVSVAGLGMDEATWKSGKSSFQRMAGEPVRISISKVTVYDNPAEAPEPGLYVAADYSNEYTNVPLHCGYLMWFRPIGGDFRITREETGYVTAEQLKSIPDARLPEIKQKLRCAE